MRPGRAALIDEAVRQAYKYSGVAVITIPKDLAWTPIEFDVDTVATARNFRKPLPV